MKFKKFIILVGLLALPALFSVRAQNEYGLPDDIKDGNILHCFDWKLNDIKKELPNIAEAGFKAVQVSPLETSAQSGANWSDLYRPYDFAFRQNGLGTASNLQSLCEEAESYGIQVIVDVVFNHVDGNGKHANWWNSNGRLRETTSMVNYGSRYSITHDRIGDYPEVNSEDPEVAQRAKEYIEELKGYGVSGIRFDAAKHIALPSEGCEFWAVVTSVPDMFYYGEILDSPGGNNAKELMKEYTTYMYVTDDSYSSRARSSAGVPTTDGNWANNGIEPHKIIYWGESHDTYANTPSYGGVSKNVSQGVIDRAYAAVACRNNGIALYLSRPNYKDFGDIKIGQKGSTHFIDKEVAEVNKFKNLMVGRADCYSQNGSSASITRKEGGAVVINKIGAGVVNVANGSAFCPIGSYIDRVSGNTFTVTSETITGTVGASGIAVLYSDDLSGIEDIVEGETTTSEAQWYTLQGVKISHPYEKGIYVKVTPDGKSQKVII